VGKGDLLILPTTYELRPGERNASRCWEVCYPPAPLQLRTRGRRSFREVVRQQWNSSRSDTMREFEEYRVDSSVLKFGIVPDTSRGAARASRLAQESARIS
jgi:hypothetical protein